MSLGRAETARSGPGGAFDPLEPLDSRHRVSSRGPGGCGAAGVAETYPGLAGSSTVTLPAHIKEQLDRGTLRLDLHCAPLEIDRDVLITRLFEAVRGEYSPLDVSQSEGISVKDMSPHDTSRADSPWLIEFNHWIELDWHSISDKRESSRVDLTVAHDLSAVLDVRWTSLTRFRARPEVGE